MNIMYIERNNKKTKPTYTEWMNEWMNVIWMNRSQKLIYTLSARAIIYIIIIIFGVIIFDWLDHRIYFLTMWKFFSFRIQRTIWPCWKFGFRLVGDAESWGFIHIDIPQVLYRFALVRFFVWGSPLLVDKYTFDWNSRWKAGDLYIRVFQNFVWNIFIHKTVCGLKRKIIKHVLVNVVEISTTGG
jgi:hypothetical protein